MPPVDEPTDLRADVLLVDDVPANLLALEAILADLGQNLVRANSGDEALRLLLDRDFAVILLDLQMPGLDGFETAKLIRSRPRSQHTPIIFLTAHESHRFPVDKAYELGAVDYLVKPLVPAILRAKVRVFVELTLKARQIERQAEQLRMAEQERAERRALAQYAVAGVLADEPDLATAGPKVLRVACEYLGWDVATLWAVDRDARVLRCVAAWHDAPGKAAFAGACLRRTFAPGEGLPGRVWNSGEAAWVEDVAADANFPRVRQAAEAGLRAACGLPIRLGRDLVGVVEFFSREARPYDGDLQLALAGVAGQVGQSLQRRRAEQELREHRERLLVTLSSIGDAVISTDAAGRVAFVNPVAQALTGWSQEEAAGRPLGEVFRILNEQTRGPGENPVDRVLREGVVVGLANHTLLVARDGTERPIADSAAPIRGEGREVRGVVLVFRDVTEQRRAEHALREQTRIAEALYRVSGLLAQERDLQRLVQTVTDEATRLTDARFGAFFFNQADKRGEPITLYALSGVPREAFADFPMPRDTAVFGPTFRGEGVVRLDDVTRDSRYGQNAPYQGTPPGHLPVRSYLAAPVVSRTGEVLGGLFFGHPEPGVFGERDERLVVGVAAAAAVALDNARLYDQLQRRAEELAEEGRRKDHFLAVLGHELRNPLSPLRNCVQMLALRGGDQQTVRAVAMMDRQVRALTRLVDDLLDLARISRGRIELRKERVELGAAAAWAAEAARTAVEGRGHRLEVVAPSAPVWLEADPVRLEQVVTNLLSNAAKYTEPGGLIRVATGREGDQAVLRVSDTGIGIRSEDLGRIFEEFTHADRVAGRVQEGLGIGLSLVRGLVRLHGGTVEAHSAGPGRGSEFVVRLPAQPEAPADQPSRPADRREGGAGRGSGPLRVLVVDDNRDAAESCASLLRLSGDEVRVAYDGPGALQAAAEFRPDAVFLDLGLPRGMNGYEVAHRLRQTPGLEKVLLVALTGYGMDEDRRRSREAGIEHHLVKPAGTEEMARVLAPLRR